MIWPRRLGGVVLVTVGSLWFLQGIGVAGGSVMSGHPIWSVIGAPLALAGVALIVSASRRRSS